MFSYFVQTLLFFQTKTYYEILATNWSIVIDPWPNSIICLVRVGEEHMGHYKLTSCYFLQQSVSILYPNFKLIFQLKDCRLLSNLSSQNDSVHLNVLIFSPLQKFPSKTFLSVTILLQYFFVGHKSSQTICLCALSLSNLSIPKHVCLSLPSQFLPNTYLE